MQSREQTGRRLRGPLAVLVAAMVVGTVGFMLIEGWSFIDAVYMVAITLTTVGYGEVHPLSTAGQAFTVVLLVVGVGAISYSLGVLVSVIFDGYVNQRWEQRRMTRRIDQLADHYIICGYGRVGREIAAQLQREGHTCLVVDQRSDALERAVKDGFLAVEGNASEDETLRRAGIGRATGLITAVQTDAENIFVTLSARALRAEMPIVARANYEDAMPKLRRAGATQVVSPYAMAGQQMARLAARPATVGFVEKLLEGAKGDLLLEELRIEQDSPVATTTLAEARRQYGGDTVVLAVRRCGGASACWPRPHASSRSSLATPSPRSGPTSSSASWRWRVRRQPRAGTPRPARWRWPPPRTESGSTLVSGNTFALAARDSKSRRSTK